MDELEMRRLAAQEWPLEFSRRNYAALYEQYEAVRAALQTALTTLEDERDTRHYECPSGSHRTGSHFT